MPYQNKNVYHLRLTAQDVIPLYLYLDDKHIDWMTNATLRAVVADLRPIIGTKLETEKNAHFGPGGPSTAVRPTVEVHRGTGYQFAYFLRKADPYAIVLKTRNYTLPSRVVQPKQPLRQNQSDGKRKRSSVESPQKPKRQRKPRKGKGKTAEIIPDSEEEAEESPLSDLDNDEPIDEPVEAPPRRSARTRKQIHGGCREDSEDEVPGIRGAAQLRDEVEPSQSEESDKQRGPEAPPSMMVDEDEEEKPKPVMQLAFRNLTMRDRYLCVVVEPWPPLPTSALSRTPSVAPRARTPRAPSIAPADFVPSIPEREETPLFLPDFDRRSATPAPVLFGSVLSTLQPMNEAEEPIADDDSFGMLAFSQMLNSVAGENPGGVEEDDEIDGSVLYGDADEMRGIIQ